MIEDVVLGHDQDVLAVDLDLGPGIRAEDHLIALLDGERNPGAGLLVEVAIAQGDDLALLGLVLGAFGQVDSRVGLGFRLGRLTMILSPSGLTFMSL